MKGRVILTYGRSLQALAAAHSLAQQGVEVIGCDDTLFMTLSFSKYVSQTFSLPDPLQVTEDAYLQALLENIEAYRPPAGVPYVLMPINWDTQLFARRHAVLAPHITLAAPPWSAIQQVDPKDALVKTALQHGLSIPQTFFPESAEALQAQMQDLQFPVFIKVPDGSGGRGLQRCENAQALSAAYVALHKTFHFSKDYKPLVQTAVSGEDYCTTVLAQQGELKAHMTYRNIRSFPADGGIGVLRETVADAPLIEIAQQLIAATQWHGVAQIDFRWDGKPDSQPYLIEVNPRFWGGLFQSIESGVDYPWLLFQMVTGQELPADIAPQIGVQTRIPVTSGLSLLEEIIHSEIDFERLDAGWQQAWMATKAGDLSTAWRVFSQHAAQAFASKQTEQQTVSEKLRMLQQARVDGLHWDDPLTSLGVLSILGALIKKGRLPEEMDDSVKKGQFQEK